MSVQQPAYGTERFLLITIKTRSQPPDRWVIRREIFTEGEPAHFYDEAAHDFVTWWGSWTTIETFGPFASRDKAREFMVVRADKAAA